jgi:hypothetical protein
MGRDEGRQKMNHVHAVAGLIFRCAFPEAPSTKIQAPEKSQTPKIQT